MVGVLTNALGASVAYQVDGHPMTTLQLGPVKLVSLDSSRVARFDVQTFTQRGERRFDLIQARVVPKRE